MADTDLPPLPDVPEGAVVKLLGDQREKDAFERWYVTEGMDEPLGSRLCHRQRLAWLARAALAAAAEPAQPVQPVAPSNLRERIGEAHDASLDNDDTGCRAILRTLLAELDADPAASQPPAKQELTQADPNARDDLIAEMLAALIACIEAQQPMQHAHAAEQARSVVAAATVALGGK